MKSLRNRLIALGILAVALISMSTRGQSTVDQKTNYLPEGLPLTASRPRPQQESVVPATKFVKVQNAIPNKYIVVLNDDVVSQKASLATRRAQVSAVADSHARAHGGRVGFIYETALKGFSIELPNEAAAIALSQKPQVRFVEEVGVFQTSAVQPYPPWGLDRIDQTYLPLNNQYVYNATGWGVTAYVIDSGIRATHADFGGRASIAVDFIAPIFGGTIVDDCVTPGNNDCSGHGTHVAGTIGGATYGVAKGVRIRSVKVCTAHLIYGCPGHAVIAGVNWVTNEHNANVSIPAVANMSLGGGISLALDTAVLNSINSGVSYALAAGNSSVDAANFSPAHVQEALTVGATAPTDQVTFFSNFGSLVDIFAPGEGIPSAWNGSDTDTLAISGTSMASPHGAGAIALYLQGRTGTSWCSSFPITGPSAPLGGVISTCPDRVNQFIKSNATLSRLTMIGPGSRNRLLWTGTLPTTQNPIDNHRFFVWQHYADFLVNEPEPDEAGLNFWTSNITVNCRAGFNYNSWCTRAKRIDVSRAFWVAAYPWLFTPSAGLTNNSEFVRLCYQLYLRRFVPNTDPGFQFWLGDLNSYGNPANQDGVNHLIDAFLSSGEYRQRFGQP